MDFGKIWKLFFVLLILGLTPFSASVSEVDVLIVADGHRLSQESPIADEFEGGMFVEEYKEAFGSVNGVDVSVYQTNITDNDGTNEPADSALGPSAENMSDYDVVVWYTLADYATGGTEAALYEYDVKQLREYLDSGGSLYINGHLMHQARTYAAYNGFTFEDFYSDVLKVRFEGGEDPRYWRFTGEPQLQQGLRYEWYDNSGEQITVNNQNQMDRKFDRSRDGVSLEGEGIYRRIISWNQNDDYGSNFPYDKPFYINQENYFSWKASGIIYAPESGTYTFNVNSDDASDVFVDGEKVAQYYQDHPENNEPGSDEGEKYPKYLEKGYHTFKARMQDQEGSSGISVKWQKPGDSSFETVPASRFFISPWKYEEVLAQSQTEGEMIFNSSGNLRLSGEEGNRVGGETFNFGLNTTIEPPEAFGVITDTCHHEEDTLTTEGQRECSYADDSLSWQNNVSVDGSLIHMENHVGKDLYLGGGESEDLAGRSFNLESSGGRDNVLILAVTLDRASTSISQITYNAEDLQELHNVEGSDGNKRLQVFYLKDPVEGTHQVSIDDPASGYQDIAVDAFIYDGVDPENPIGDNATSSNENEVRTEVGSNPDDKVIDFLASPGGNMESVDSMDPFRNYHENYYDNPFYQYGSTKEGSGTVEMSWSGDSHTAHSVLSLNEVDRRPKYYVETDQDSPEEGNYPDDLASGLVQASPGDYRTVHTSFGLEAIKSDASRAMLAKDILNFLTGPRTKNTRAYAGQDLPETEVDESRYANSTFNLTSTGFTPEEDTEIVNARFFNSNSSLGFEPIVQEGFENVTEFNTKWDRSNDVVSEISDRCGVKKGDQALVLTSTDSRDKVTIPMDYNVNTNSYQDLSVEFWVKVPDGSGSCDSPDPDENTEDLFVEYWDGNSWSTSVIVRAGGKYSGGSWRKVEGEIPESGLNEDFRLRLRKGSSDAPDSYVVDELELDSSINPVSGGNGFFTKDNVTVRAEGLYANKTSYDLSNDADGINLTYSVQFKDGSRQGYWGDSGESWIQVDIVKPSDPNFRIEKKYVNDSTVNVTVDKKLETRTPLIPDLVRFSCDQSKWSNWRVRKEKDVQEFELDITSDSAGCGADTGNKTIYAQFRDYAGNMVQQENKDWVVYDTKKPRFEDIGPRNDSAIRPSDLFTLNMSDDYAILEGSKSVETAAGDESFTNFLLRGEDEQNIDVNESGGLNGPFSEGSSGEKSFVTYVFDEALNVRRNYFEYDLDITPPRVFLVEAGGQRRGNNTAIKPEENLTFRIEESNFAKAVLNEGKGNETFDEDVTFTFRPQWVEGYRTVELWLEDEAGNRNYTVYNYSVDGSAPVFEASSVRNESYILNTTSVAYNFSDQYAGVSSFSSLTGAATSSDYSSSDYVVEPSQDSEGPHSLSFQVRDRADNVGNFTFEYVIDTVPPDVFSPYVESGWSGSNTSVELKATDDKNLSRIRYCVKSEVGGCSIQKTSQPGQNVTVDVGCSDENVCRKVVKYEASDSAGNVNGTYETEQILIDKKAPVESRVTGPESGNTVGGTVDLETYIEDSGSGIRDINYTVYNASNSSQIFARGDLNETAGYDTVWNSSQEITSINSVVFNFTAVDKVGNEVKRQRQFEVDNSQTSVTIRRPYREYVNDSFELLIDARRPGERVLETHNYSIYNSSGNLVENGSQAGIGKSEHEFNLSLEASDLGADGNYTLNSTATDNESGMATASTWFILDTEAPKVSLEKGLNRTWQGEDVDIGYTASDDREPGSLSVSYKDSAAASWKGDLSPAYDGTSFRFAAGSLCDDSSRNDCFVRMVASDAAGNTNTSLLQFKVDTSDPSASIDSPPAGSWYRDDFSVSYTVSDNVLPFEQLSCDSRAGTSAFDSQICDNPIEVGVGPGQECSEQGEGTCRVEIRVEDKVDRTDTADRTYSIDYEEPRILGLRPQRQYVNNLTDFAVNFTDSTSGVSYSIWNASGSKSDLVNGTDFRPDWNSSGRKTLKLKINDTAGNLLTETETYTFDNKKPELGNVTLSKEEGLNDDVRIYRGENLEFIANISDNIQVNRSIVEITRNGSKNNITMQKASGSYADGSWTAQVGNRPETGLYNVSAVYIVDEAGNRRAVSEGLPEFKVVNYSLDITSGADVNAGFRGVINFSVDFNKTRGNRSFGFRFSNPSSESFEIDNLTCSYSGRCNISRTGASWNIEAEGSESVLELSLDPSEFTPRKDTNISFSTDLKGNLRKDKASFRAPNLSITDIKCAQSCTVGQGENFTVQVDTVNNATGRATGKAIDTYLELKNKGGGSSYLRRIGNISSGSSNTFSFANLSIPDAGSSDVNVTFKDNLTEAYSVSEILSIQVLDTEKPDLLESTLSSERINVNSSVELEVRVEDNKGVDSVNVTLVNSSDQKKNISLEKSEQAGVRYTWQDTYSTTSVRGIYNFTEMYAVDVNGNYRNVTLGKTFEVSQLEMNASVLQNKTNVSDPVDFSVNITGNSEPISSIELNVTGPKDSWIEAYGSEEVGNTNTLSYDRFPNSGNYSFRVEANAGSTVARTTENVSVKYGNSTVENLNGNSSRIVLPEDGPYNFTWELEPVEGGLRDVNLELSSNDTSVVNPAVASRSIGDLYYENGARKVWYRAGLNDPQPGTANLTLDVTPQKGDASQEEITVEVRPSDNSDPVIKNVTLDRKLLNLEQGLSFDVNVTDNSLLENVTLKVSYPEEESNITENFRMSGEQKGLYQKVFENTNETGSYNYKVVAWDIAGNKDSYSGSFNVTDELKLGLEANQQTYVKGEDIVFDLSARDASGQPLQNYNVSATLSKAGTNTTLEPGPALEEFSYDIDQSDPPSRDLNPDLLPLDYTLYLSVEKGPITQNISKEVGVTRLLDNLFIPPDYVEPGSNFTVRVNWTEPVGQKIGASSFTAFAGCTECPPRGELEFEIMEPPNETKDFYTSTFQAPESDSATIQLLAFDSSGNSESQDYGQSLPPTYSIQVGGQGTETNNTGGGGFPSVPGGGGGPSMEITRLSPDVSVPASADDVNLSVNTNIAATCVYSRNSIPDQVSFSEASEFQSTGGVLHSTEVEADRSITYSYDVMCASENANSTSSIVFSRGEIDVTSFRVPSFPGSLTPGNETVSQGENVTASFIVENNMSSDDLNLRFNYSPECCEGFVMRDGEVISEAEIGPQGSRQFKLGVDVPLSAEEGTYRPTILIRSENSSQPPKRREPDFQILDSEEISRFEELVQRSQILNSSIQRYSIAGIDTSRERELFDELVDSIQDANRSIQNDNITGLRQALDTGYRKARQIDSGLQDKAWKKYLLLNWWKWALGFVILYIMFFLVTVVGIPYYRIQTELVRIESELDDQVEARKKGEKQYFKRQIDKDTFNSMMQDRQNEILELRGEKEDLKEELDGFLWNKLTLENYLKAPWKGMEELEKWWAANRRARENLNRDQDDEGKE